MKTISKKNNSNTFNRVNIHGLDMKRSLRNFFLILAVFFLSYCTYIFFQKNFYHSVSVSISADAASEKSLENFNEFKLYYILKNRNEHYEPRYSKIVRLNNSKKNEIQKIEYFIERQKYKNSIESVRLDFDENKDVVISVHSFIINGHELINNSGFELHDMEPVSKEPNLARYRVTGSDPFIYLDTSIRPDFNTSVIGDFLLIFALFAIFSGLLYFRACRYVINRYSYALAPLIMMSAAYIYAGNSVMILSLIPEWLFFIAILELLQNHPLVRKIISLAVLSVYGMQCASIVNSGNFVVVLTLENISELSSVGKPVIVISSVIIGFFVILALYTPDRLISANQKLKRINLYIIATILAVSVAICNLFFIGSPFFSFWETFYRFINARMMVVDQNIKDQQKILYGKDQIVFDRHDDPYSYPDLKGRNVIVVFSEGFSANLLGINNGMKDLTPNIDALSARSLYVDNYFNHTAATFRGIRGQLSSSYQYLGGFYSDNSGIGQISEKELQERYNNTVIGLPAILRENGYHSYFIQAHPKTDNLPKMLKTLFFDEVFCSDDYAAKQGASLLTDRELFLFINELIESKKLKEPYFLGIYNIGTHLGQDSPDRKYHDGSNILLNTVTNFDNSVSMLIKKFEDPQFAEKNALIITADHSTYPSPQYKDTIDRMEDYFIGKIPLIIYTGGIRPEKLDVHGTNSLSLAPTVLHALGIKNGRNYFLGCYLFDHACKSDFSHISAVGDNFYQTSDLRASVCDDERIIKKIKKFYHLSN